MALGTRGQLLSESKLLTERMRKTASIMSAQSDVFLAHSSHDNDIVRGAAVVLRNAGSHPYADFFDPAAKNLSANDFGAFFANAIADTERLIVLLTTHTHSSKWVPWELGLAHGSHSLLRAAVWPVVDGAGTIPSWAKQEYLLQYPTVEWVKRRSDDRPGWCVSVPSKPGFYWKLAHWLSL